LGELADAETAARRALEEDPASALAWDMLARTQLEQGQAAPALDSARRATELNPDYSAAQYDLARAEIALLQQGQRGDQGAAAVAALEASLALSPQFLPALELLASVRMARGELPAAEELYRRIVALAPRHVEAQLGLARLAGAQGRPGEGVEAARLAAEAAPERLDAWLLLANLAFDGGKPAVAAQALERVRTLAPEGSLEAQWAAALQLALDGKRQQLDSALRRLLSRQPRFGPGVQLFLTNAAALGREAEARAFLAALSVRF
jgi:tetratricopeptide (TPR) repeat protein